MAFWQSTHSFIHSMTHALTKYFWAPTNSKWQNKCIRIDKQEYRGLDQQLSRTETNLYLICMYYFITYNESFTYPTCMSHIVALLIYSHSWIFFPLLNYDLCNITSWTNISRYWTWNKLPACLPGGALTKIYFCLCSNYCLSNYSNAFLLFAFISWKMSRQ